MVDIGTRLRVLRAAKGLRAGELAERAHVTRATVSFIENGHVQPKTETLEALARALGVHVSVFFEEGDWMWELAEEKAGAESLEPVMTKARYQRVDSMSREELVSMVLALSKEVDELKEQLAAWTQNKRKEHANG
jgi:transcriptional regulator with XRE-family HTH domain